MRLGIRGARSYSMVSVIGTLAMLLACAAANAQFTNIGAGLTGVRHSGAAWGDYDNDGDVDVVATGQDAAGTPTARVWRNDGGAFTNIGAGLTGVAFSSAAWGDYDNDGDVDLLVTGLTVGGTPDSKVWRNDGGVFTDIGAGLTGVAFSSAAWGDYDNDGDLDIVLTGANGGGAGVAEIWENNGGVFSEISAGLTGVRDSSVAWGDYDNDGDLDVVLAGESAGGPVAEIWRNDGGGTFTDIGAGLTGVGFSNAAWGDYDNDGDLDIALTGLDAGAVPRTEIWNNDAGVFTDIGAGLTGVWESSVAWGDYDNDGDLDLLMTGEDVGGGRLSRVWRNDGGGSFVDLGGALGGVAQSSASWGDYDNDGDLDILLTGENSALNPVAQIWRNNLAVVTDVSFADIHAGLTGVRLSSVAWADYDHDGDKDVLLTGFTSTFTAVSQVWRNDGGTFVNINAGLTGVVNSSVAWGDYDNDGDPDILLTGQASSGRVSQVWRNNGGGSFTNINAGLTGVINSSVAWGDYDHDGDLDILLTGLNSVNAPVSQIWRNDGGTFTNIGAALTGVAFSSVAWGDYDRDGDLDVLLTGSPGGAPVSQIWRNDAGVFTNIGAGLTGVRMSSAAWGDFDNDGDLDVLQTGLNASSIRVSQIWQNDAGVFSNIGAGLTPVANSSVAWGDCDNDGDLDILLTGDSGVFGRVSQIWSNDGGAFSDVAAGLMGVAFSGTAWCDYDNDGDLDVLQSGFTPSNATVTQIWQNTQTKGVVAADPVADAGGPYTVECRDHADGSTRVMLDGSGSSDPDGGVLSYLWSADQGVFDDATLAQPTLDVTGIAPGTVINVTLVVDNGVAMNEASTTVTVQDTVAPLITCPADIVQLATSPAGNVVNYAPTAVDACDADPAVVSSPESGSLFAVGTTLVTVTAMDASGNASECSFNVTIVSVDEMLETMQGEVGDLGLNSGNANALVKLLENVRSSYASGKTNAACAQLAAFTSNLQSQIATGKADAELGEELLSTAHELQSALGC